MRSPRGRSVLGFLFVWLMVGFATGTLVLVALVPWLTSTMRAAGWSQGSEDLAMWGIIAAYVASSLLLALVLTRWMHRSQRPIVRAGVPIAATLLAAGALWGWMNPGVYARAAGGEGGRVETRSGAEFVFGPYPDYEKLKALKERGFTAVVSLQHPAVVPFEPQGIKAEREAAEELGIPLIHAPMLPWVSDNESSLQKIRKIARTGSGRYYVHCGLGRDRVNVVRRMLERDGARLAAEGGAEAARSFGVRERPLERGWHEEIARDVWLVPYPNEHEFFGNMLAGQVESVALLLDPAENEQAAWVEHTRALMSKYGVQMTELPLPRHGLTRAPEVARSVAGLERPLVVIVPYTHPRPDTAVAHAFEQAFRGLRGLEPPPADRPATVARRDSLAAVSSEASAAFRDP